MVLDLCRLFPNRLSHLLNLPKSREHRVGQRRKYKATKSSKTPLSQVKLWVFWVVGQFGVNIGFVVDQLHRCESC